ncbi:hypothetical protein PYCC9005_001074 [Savitreella phatthalungensis]
MEPLASGDPRDDNTLKQRLAGPSVAKSGQEGVDQAQVNKIIYDASEGSKYFQNEHKRDAQLTVRIARTLKQAEELRSRDLSGIERAIDRRIAELEQNVDLSQTIVTVDVDAFYASVEELDRPELKDLPMGVGTGVLTTANYHARKFGVRSAMPVYIAKKLCPELVCVPLNFDKYTRKAGEIRQVLARVDPNYQAGSLDEAYMNATDWLAGQELTREEAIANLRDSIYRATGLTVSAGVAANARLSKILSNVNKPDGQCILANDRKTIIAFMSELPVRKVNGIGKVLERQLEALGVRKCKDIYRQRALLSQVLGHKTFSFLLEVYLGIGPTRIGGAGEDGRKSIGTESTFRELASPNDLRVKLRTIAEDLQKDCERTDWAGRTIHLKLKRDTYEVITKQRALQHPCYKADDLYAYAICMLEKEFPICVRLMGLRLTHLSRIKRKSPATFFDSLSSAAHKRLDRPSHVEQDDDPSTTLNLTRADQATRDGKSPRVDSCFPDKLTGESKTSTEEDRNLSEDLPRCPICARQLRETEIDVWAHVEHCLNTRAIREATAGDSHITPLPSAPKTSRDKAKSLSGWLLRPS